MKNISVTYELIGGPYCGKANITELPNDYCFASEHDNKAYYKPVYEAMVRKGLL